VIQRPVFVPKSKPEPKSPKRFFKPKKQKIRISRPARRSVTIKFEPKPIVEAPPLKVGGLRNHYLENDDGDFSELKLLPLR
jgi:hypothetical protein